MDKLDFIFVVDDILDKCNSKEEMNSRFEEMRKILQRLYLKIHTQNDIQT